MVDSVSASYQLSAYSQASSYVRPTGSLGQNSLAPTSGETSSFQPTAPSTGGYAADTVSTPTPAKTSAYDRAALNAPPSGEKQGRVIQDELTLSDAAKKFLGPTERKGIGESFQAQKQTAIDLAGANLAGVDLSNQDFSQTSFAGGSLAQADLAHSNFSNANFVGADLRGANFLNADVTGANFSGANLEGADLSGVTGLTRDQLTYARVGQTTVLPGSVNV